MLIRVGIEGGRRPVLQRASELGAPILVSANSLWDNRSKRFSGWQCYTSHDVALDSGGFVAMKRYGGYRWTIPQYVGLAKEMRPTWWAQMDFCCEPEIAGHHTAVIERIQNTAHHLRECQRIAADTEAVMPMPVLQGWKPADYCHGPAYDEPFDWPDLVGIGSVCRRQVNGSDGILAVIEALDQVVPDHVRFHMFGVKSQAIEELVANFPHRSASMDSMAWNMDCRWKAYKSGQGSDGNDRANAMGDWYQRQVSRLNKPKQMRLL